MLSHSLTVGNVGPIPSIPRNDDPDQGSGTVAFFYISAHPSQRLCRLNSACLTFALRFMRTLKIPSPGVGSGFVSNLMLDIDDLQKYK